MNLVRDDVVDNLMHLSVETRELLDNCEKVSEEMERFKSKSEVLEEELHSVNNENEKLKKENQKLRAELLARTDLKEDWMSVVQNANEVLSSVTPNILDIFEKFRANENARIQSERGLVALKEENIGLRVEIEQKNVFMSEQNADFLAIKKTVDDYQSEISRLDKELKDCHLRVSTLNENLEAINTENFDLAEYTNFKNFLKKIGTREDVNEAMLKLQTLYETDELFDAKLSFHLNTLAVGDSTIVDHLPESENNSNVVTRVKYHLEKALYVIEKLNENNNRSISDYESVIQTKNDEIAKLKEISCHLGFLYNEILEKTLEQCRDNVAVDMFAGEKIDRLVTANKTLHDDFVQLRRICVHSHRYNDQLFAKFSQLSLWCRILKIRVSRMTASLSTNECSASHDSQESRSSFSLLSNFFRLFDEFFDQVTECRLQYTRQIEDSTQVLADYENRLAADDYLKTTVDNMTQEVKRLTCQVEQQMSEKIREIESLKGEMDSVKTDNRQLANKIKNCNREIISLSTENFDLNERLSIFAKIECDCETLKSELNSTKSKLERYENCWCNVTIGGTGRIAQLRDFCVELKRQNTKLKEVVSTYRSTNDHLLRRTVQLVSKAIEDGNRNSDESKLRNTVDLSTLRTKCSQFKRENQNLKLIVQGMSRQLGDEISSLKSNVYDALVSCSSDQQADTPCQADVVNLLERCRDLKKCNQRMKDVVSFSSVHETIEEAGDVLRNKLEQISCDLSNLHTNLGTAIDAKNLYEQSVSTHLQSILKITRDLKSSRELLLNLVETFVGDFVRFSSTVRQNIETAITHTFERIKDSIALSNEEVIKEMQEVNSELKSRGETIFVLKQRVDELTTEKNRLSSTLAQQETMANDLNAQICTMQTIVAEKESRINSINDDLANLARNSSVEIEKKTVELSNLMETLEITKSTLRSKEETISSLELEIAKAKDIQAADGDVSSMGNISRTEEVSRLRDVEDSFEERYMKLRCIAVKMKQTIADLKQKLKNENSERNAIQSKLNVAIEQAQRNKALQHECDRLTDELELKTNEIKELKKIIVEADKKGEKSDLLAKQYENVLGQKNDLAMENESFTSLVEQLRQEKFVEETLKKEMEREVQRLKQKVKEKEDSLKKLQNDLEQANLEVRKRGTLSLEMKDYEKTISDLTDKLRVKNITVDELNERLRISTESNTSLMEHVKDLQMQIHSFGANSKIADEQILNLNTIISEHEKDLESKNDKLKQLLLQVEEEKSQNEYHRLQFAESVTEISSLKQLLKDAQHSATSQLKLSLNKIKILEERLKKKENEFDTLKEDFEAYKIRARNVLQKHKTENNSNSNDLKLQIKIDDLSQTVKELRKRLDGTLTDLDNRKTELKLLEACKEKLQSKVKEVQEMCAEKTREFDNIRTEFKSYKLNNETLVECYKNEIETLRASCQKLNSMVEDLRLSKTHQSADDQSDNLTVRVERKDDEDVKDENLNNNEYPKHDLPPPILSNNEDNSTRVKGHNRELISLEKLLKTDVTEERQVSDSNAAELKKNIEILENQVTYLNGVLNESEKNAARSEQHVAWLKDVNRRLQKTIDRAPHLQNGEYLKNVLFNFFTFPDGEEKCKLITILETLLQLTPEEKGILSAIAKGDRSEQKRSSGFASFLKFG